MIRKIANWAMTRFLDSPWLRKILDEKEKKSTKVSEKIRAKSRALRARKEAIAENASSTRCALTQLVIRIVDTREGDKLRENFPVGRLAGRQKRKMPMREEKRN